MLSGEVDREADAGDLALLRKPVQLTQYTHEDNAVPPDHGDSHEQTGMDVVAPTPTCPAGAVWVAGRGEAPAALAGSSPGHHPIHELQHELPPAADQTVQPWVVAALGLCSEKPPRGC